MILNTTMPADKALKIIRSIFESQPTIEIIFTDSKYPSRELACTKNQYDTYRFDGDITIVGINQIIPTYSIGDKVLILSTGELGEVGQFDGSYIHLNEENRWYRKYHWSQLAKLPNDL